MPDAAKSPAQIACDALNRKRKPHIRLDEKPADVIIKAKDEEIARLARQIKDLQTDRAQKEAYILELENRVQRLENPQPTQQPQPLTEEVPEQPGQRRTRRPAAAQAQPQQKPEEGKQGEEPKEQPQQPEPKPEPPKPAAPVRPGDGIAEED